MKQQERSVFLGEFIVRGPNDVGCERKIKLLNGSRGCLHRSRRLMKVPALGGYAEFSVRLCRIHAKQAEMDWQATEVKGVSFSELRQEMKQ